MGKKRVMTAVLAMVFSLFSLSAAYAEEKTESQGEQKVQQETQKQEKEAQKQEKEAPQEEEKPRIKYVETAENPTALDGQYIPVLMYHHFAIRNMGQGNGTVTTVEELEDQLRYFREAGYRIISLEELDRILTKAERKKELGETEGEGLDLGIQYLCITMDDGYYSNYELAYPLFKKYRTPASIFAVTDYITNQIGIKKFTWKQAAEMEKSGYVKIYSHTSNHKPVEAGQEEAFLASVREGDEALQTYLREDRVKALTYPNGRNTAESRRMLTEEGYRLQFTVEQGVITNSTSRDAIPRIMVSSGMDGRDVVRKIQLVAEKNFAAKEGK